MALALYRKYRPRTFAEIIGQEHVTEPLSQALRSGRLHHAYLFSGPRGCGKTSSARILARSLNCEQGPTPEPCGQCASCRSLANDGGGSIDVIEIDAASHGGVDDARELREKAFFAPAGSRYKIYVIDEAHMVSSAGFNALLKLVEEPPDYVKFIFATTEPEKVLGTIKSRTHHYPFRLIPPATLRPYLEQLCTAEGVRVDPAVFPLVVRAGGGSARDTLSVLDQLIAGAGPDGVDYARAVLLLGVTDVTLIDEMCDAIAAGDGAAAYATIDRVAQAGHDARRFAADLLERFRDLIVLQQVPDAVAKGLIDGPADQVDRMTGQAGRLGPATLSRCADIVHAGLVEMRGTTAPRLLLELIAARMLLPGAEDTTGSLLQRLERMERRLTLQEPAPVTAPPRSSAASVAVGVDGVPGAPAGAPAPVERLRAPDAAAAVGPPAAAAPAAAAPAAGTPVGAAPAAGTPVGAAAAGTPVGAAPAGAATEGAAAAPGGPGTAASSTSDAPAVGGRPGAVPMPDAPAEPDPGAPVVGQLTAAAVRDTWPEVVSMVGRRSKKIAALAQGATVRDLDGQTVVLVFRFPAHARMVADQPNLLVEALYEVLGGRWQIRCEIGDGGAAAPARPAAPAQPRAGAPTDAPGAQALAGAPTEAPPAVPAADDWPEPARPGGLSGGGPPAVAPPPGGSARDAAAPAPDPRSVDHAAGAAPAVRHGAAAPVAPDRSPEPPTARIEPGAARTELPAARTEPPAARTEFRTARTEPRAARTEAHRAASPGTAASGRGAPGGGAPGTGGPRAGGIAAARAAASRSGAWSDGSPAEEPPYDPEYDGPIRPGRAGATPAQHAPRAYDGFDPGDEPLDDVVDEKTARQSSEQQAVQLLRDAFGAEQIGEH